MRLKDTISIYAGGPGSGPKAPCDDCGPKTGKKKGWSKMTRDERLNEARKDPRQMGLFPQPKEYKPPKGPAKTALGVNRDYKSHGKKVSYNLAWHADRMKQLMEHGMSKEEASSQAYKEMTQGTSLEAWGKKPKSFGGFHKPNRGVKHGSKGHSGFHRPNMSMLSNKEGEPMVGNMSRQHFNSKEDFNVPKPGTKGGTVKSKKMEALGEPMAGNDTYSVIEPRSSFHPPSLKKPQRVPTDDPGEKNDRFLDVTNRKAAHEHRMKMLKRSAPGGLPALVPVYQTGVEQHMGVHQPGMFGKAKRVIARPWKPKRTFVPFNRRGSA